MLEKKNAKLEAQKRIEEEKAEKEREAQQVIIDAEKAEKLERKLQLARMELEVTQLSAELDLHNAELAVEDAQRELHETVRAHELFMKHELPTTLAGAHGRPS